MTIRDLTHNGVCQGLNSLRHTFAVILLSCLIPLSCFSCSGGSDDDPQPKPQPPVVNPEPPAEETTDWQQVATQSTYTLTDFYWDNDRHFFRYRPNKADTPAEDWSYWPQAHAMDVIIDAYLRTGDAKWKSYFPLWYEGIKQKSGGGYTNDFVDDMEWICLTMLRLYEATHEQNYMDTAQMLWDTIRSNWNTQGGGGIAWKQSQPYSKNACSNGPAGIIACRMYRLNKKKEDLDLAKKIYEWESNTLVDIKTGAVYDNLNAQTGAVTNWIFTYNEGTYMGMAHELYQLTGEDFYLDMAVKAADYTIRNLTNSSGILKDEGSGDGGLFKAVFVRYFALLLKEKGLKDDIRKRYADFLGKNAKVLHEQGAGNGNLYGGDWTMPGTWDNDLPTQTSGCTLLEAWAAYAAGL